MTKRMAMWKVKKGGCSRSRKLHNLLWDFRSVSSHNLISLLSFSVPRVEQLTIGMLILYLKLVLN